MSPGLYTALAGSWSVSLKSSAAVSTSVLSIAGTLALRRHRMHERTMKMTVAMTAKRKQNQAAPYNKQKQFFDL